MNARSFFAGVLVAGLVAAGSAFAQWGGGGKGDFVVVPGESNSYIRYDSKTGRAHWAIIFQGEATWFPVRECRSGTTDTRCNP